MFKNREDAGHKIAEAIKEYRLSNPLLLGIPRGGVPVAAVAEVYQEWYDLSDQNVKDILNSYSEIMEESA